MADQQRQENSAPPPPAHPGRPEFPAPQMKVEHPLSAQEMRKRLGAAPQMKPQSGQ